MDDGFSEEDKEKILKMQLADIEARRSAQEEESQDYMENIFDFHKYTADPGLRKVYNALKEIDKNWVFGNFNPLDEAVILELDGMIDDIDALLPDLPNNKLKIAFLRDIFSRITVSRGRKGFAATLFVTQIGKTKAELLSHGEKKGGLSRLFSKKKEGE